MVEESLKNQLSLQLGELECPNVQNLPILLHKLRKVVLRPPKTLKLRETPAITME